MSHLGDQSTTVSIWRKLADGFVAFCKAMEMSELEFQHARLEAMERRLAELERPARTD